MLVLTRQHLRARRPPRPSASARRRWRAVPRHRLWAAAGCAWEGGRGAAGRARVHIRPRVRWNEHAGVRVHRLRHPARAQLLRRLQRHDLCVRPGVFFTAFFSLSLAHFSHMPHPIFPTYPRHFASVRTLRRVRAKRSRWVLVAALAAALRWASRQRCVV